MREKMSRDVVKIARKIDRRVFVSNGKTTGKKSQNAFSSQFTQLERPIDERFPRKDCKEVLTRDELLV